MDPARTPRVMRSRGASAHTSPAWGLRRAGKCVSRGGCRFYVAGTVTLARFQAVRAKFADSYETGLTRHQIRRPRGRDILAACGQLKSESEKVRASARRAATQS